MTPDKREPTKTPWYPPHIKPVRKGVYLATVYKGEVWYRYWDGKQWLCGGPTIRDAASDEIPFGRDVHWRGLSSNPRGKK